ncbi:SMC-Scp complex subunit ScpB [Dokdonella soli]|uniref:SMC-Scp complex subunit ScpB n=1 Tax=Dokdonella soli TaxID=529810 RepID=A0ABN1ICF8_9GAMM
METHQLKRIIEAALLASAQPLTLLQISGLFDEFNMPPHDDLARALGELQGDCADRGVELVEVASGFRYQVRQDVHPFVSRLWSERQTRYSRALLETLSLIAYRQPITRAEIEQIRGVAVSTNIVRTLEEREWVRVVGYRDLPGKPALFGTTKQFLDYFSLKSLDELPPLSEIRDIEDLDPQLAFDTTGDAIPAIISVEGDAFEAGSADEEMADATTQDFHDHAGHTTTAVAHDDDAAAHLPSSPSEEPTIGAAHEDTSESTA